MPLFGVVLDEYLATLGKVKDSHITDLCHARHLRPFFGDMKIWLITKDTIERYKAHRQPEILALRRNVGKNPKVVSFASVNRELTLMQGILTKAVAAGLINQYTDNLMYKFGTILPGDADLVKVEGEVIKYKKVEGKELRKKYPDIYWELAKDASFSKLDLSMLPIIEQSVFAEDDEEK